MFPVPPEEYELTTDSPSCEKEAHGPCLESQVGHVCGVAAWCMSWSIQRHFCLSIYLSMLPLMHASSGFVLCAPFPSVTQSFSAFE